MLNRNKSYLNQLLSDSFYYSISKIIPGLTGLISVLLFFRWIGPEEYGKFSIVFSFSNLIAAFCFGWLNQSILRFRSIYNSRSEILSPILIGFIFGILLLTILTAITSFFEFPISFSYILIVFLASSIGIFNIVKSIFQSEERPNKVILITSMQSFLMILCTTLLLKFYNNKSESLIFGISLGYLIPILFHKKLFSKNMFSKKYVKKINFFFNYGAPISLWLGISLSLSFLDRYFIEYHFGTSLMGSYAGFSEFIIRIFSIVIFPITLAVHPILMNTWNKNKNIHDALIKIFQACFVQSIIFIMMLIPLIIFKDFFFYLIQSMVPKLDNSMNEIMIPIFIGGFLWQLSLILHKTLEIEERTLIMVICIILCVVVNLIGNIYFLPKVGILATAYTMIISALTYIISSILFSSLFRNFIKR